MGIFQQKKADKKPMTKEEALHEEERFLDEYFREELRNHSRWYFEKILQENGALFKQDLEATVEGLKSELKEHITTQLDTTLTQVNTYLKEHVTSELDARFSEYDTSLRAAQTEALETVTKSATELQEQHKQLADTLEQNVTEQKALLHDTFEQNKAQMVAVQDEQKQALEFFKQSTQELRDSQKKLMDEMTESVAAQKETLVSGFEQNMAQIIEHYLLEALGDQYDLKAQLPAIVQQMESNKQAIADDMKL